MTEKLLSLQLAYGHAVYALNYWKAVQERLHADIEALAVKTASNPSQGVPDDVDAGGPEQ